MIVVYTADEDFEFEDATRFSTDEHNNLELYGGPSVGGRPPEELMEIFADGYWRRVGVSVDED